MTRLCCTREGDGSRRKGEPIWEERQKRVTDRNGRSKRLSGNIKIKPGPQSKKKVREGNKQHGSLTQKAGAIRSNGSETFSNGFDSRGLGRVEMSVQGLPYTWVLRSSCKKAKIW